MEFNAVELIFTEQRIILLVIQLNIALKWLSCVATEWQEIIPVGCRLEVAWILPSIVSPSLLWSLQFQYAVREIGSQPVIGACLVSISTASRCNHSKYRNIIIIIMLGCQHMKTHVTAHYWIFWLESARMSKQFNISRKLKHMSLLFVTFIS